MTSAAPPLPDAAALMRLTAAAELHDYRRASNPLASGAVPPIPGGRFPALGNAVAARPSGTEPKIKFYLFAVAEPCAAADLPAAKAALTKRLDAIEADLRALVGV